jgi:hypothetical protein
MTTADETRRRMMKADREEWHRIKTMRAMDVYMGRTPPTFRAVSIDAASDGSIAAAEIIDEILREDHREYLRTK